MSNSYDSGAGLVGQCKRQSRVVLVVDSGFSFTHVVPILDDKIIQEGVVRYTPPLNLRLI